MNTRGPVQLRLTSGHADAVAGHVPPSGPVDLPPRALFLVGGQEGWARVCGWCKTPRSDIDAAKIARGVPISHGLCASCEAKHFPNDAA